MKKILKDNEHFTLVKNGQEIHLDEPQTNEDMEEVVAAAINKVNTRVTMVEWAELKALRDASLLTPGMWYQITDHSPMDYEMQISQGEAFDILVLATDINAVSKIARAKRKRSSGGGDIPNVKLYKTDPDSYPDEVDYDDYLLYTGQTMEFDGDTYYVLRKYEGDEETDYYALVDRIIEEGSISTDDPVSMIGINEDGEEYGNSGIDVLVEAEYYEAGGGGEEEEVSSIDYDSMVLWYNLDNDTERFSWADPVNGKGVIYMYSDGQVTKHLDPDMKMTMKDNSIRFRKYTAVDLGLPSGNLWCDCNLGAEKPEDYGLYFSWGSIEGFDKDSGKSFSGTRVSEGNWSGPYGKEHGSELGDSDNIPACEYFDAARNSLGAPWRMPTQADFQELIDECAEYEFTEQNGVNGLLVTGVNGNTIFLPASGYFNGSALDDRGLYGYYWSSSFKDAYFAYYLRFGSGDVYPQNDDSRVLGLTIRPIINPKEVFIDLGLPSGIKWAACNLGATKPEEDGKYFSWGNVDGYTAADNPNFSQNNYDSSDGHNLSGDIPRNNTYDAAIAALGDKCRMPTKEEFKELYDNTVQTWIETDDYAGMKFISKINGNSVFFPASGTFDGASLYSGGSVGYYWSSSFRGAHDAYSLNFSRGDVGPQDSNVRYNGHTVRAVQD